MTSLARYLGGRNAPNEFSGAKLVVRHKKVGSVPRTLYTPNHRTTSHTLKWEGRTAERIPGQLGTAVQRVVLVRAVFLVEREQKTVCVSPLNKSGGESTRPSPTMLGDFTAPQRSSLWCASFFDIYFFIWSACIERRRYAKS